ncbi:hypothetical protein QAD02_022265 [Eretmocerus hayati]|uniref:Uncharacterized protein n=1 Tax=Eretmocerus hayati TaxID=131215 RepID=A0ACC2PUM5_9HYME|nr:hypothetical protein QAD02_022265 [Eretmocerus hayati]
MGKACYDCPLNITDCYRPHCIPIDGVHKLLYVVNRQIPGPLIEVCQNDNIVVDVRNAMISESTTIHWHGMKQRRTPYMDGVPYGTHFWHSHIGAQRGVGLFGALIVHPLVQNDPHRLLYDYDYHYMVIGDWSHLDGTNAEIRQYHDTFTLPHTILINGRGRFQSFDGNDGSKVYTPIAVFNVEQFKRYRFRLIHAGVEDCATQISIDNHSLLVISLDNEDIVPIEVDVINLWAGERIARLRYSSAPNRDPSSPTGYQLPKYTRTTRVLNPYQGDGVTQNNTDIYVPWLTSIAPADITLRPVPDQQIYISYDFYKLDNYEYHRKNLYGYDQVPFLRRIGSLQLNHISLKLPSFPLMSQRDMIKPGSFCNSTNIPQDYCTKEQCACTHVLRVRLNSVVELVFVDEGQYAVENHPLHLHGHSFRVVASQGFSKAITTDEVKQLDRVGKIHRNLNQSTPRWIHDSEISCQQSWLLVLPLPLGITF